MRMYRWLRSTNSVPSECRSIPAAFTRIVAHNRMRGSMIRDVERTAAMASTEVLKMSVSTNATKATQMVRSIRAIIVLRAACNEKHSVRRTQHAGLLKYASAVDKETPVPETVTATAVLEEEASSGTPVMNDLTIHVAT